jgi:TonB family protein
VAWSGLDAKPRALYQPSPVYPRAFDQTRISGTAEVEFFIDPNGQAQLPRVLAASTPEFGWSAATAVQQWIFEAPRKNGRAVFARAQIPIEFHPIIRIAR